MNDVLETPETEICAPEDSRIRGELRALYFDWRAQDPPDGGIHGKILDFVLENDPAKFHDLIQELGTRDREELKEAVFWWNEIASKFAEWGHSLRHDVKELEKCRIERGGEPCPFKE